MKNKNKKMKKNEKKNNKINFDRPMSGRLALHEKALIQIDQCVVRFVKVTKSGNVLDTCKYPKRSWDGHSSYL